MVQIANAFIKGIAQLFSIEFPGLGISFFWFFIGVLILHAVINAIFAVYGIQSEPTDIVSSVAYDTIQDKIPGIAKRQTRFDPELLKAYGSSKIKAGQFMLARNRAEYKQNKQHNAAIRMGKRAYRMQQHKNTLAMGKIVGRNVAIKANRKGLGSDLDKIFR